MEVITNTVASVAKDAHVEGDSDGFCSPLEPEHVDCEYSENIRSGAS